MSSVIVDINKAAKQAPAEASGAKRALPETGPTGAPKRPILQHQTSLSASASAAVGAASEAGKFIASKLSNEVNLKGAKEMVLAAASHLKGAGAPSSRIKFTNLEGDEDDDDESARNDELDELESTMEDEDDDDEQIARRQRHKRNRRNQSVLGAAISSYKQKQMGGYKKAAYDDDEFDDDDDDEEDYDDDDDDDEKSNLRRSGASGKRETIGSQSDSGQRGKERTDGAGKPTVGSSDDELNRFLTADARKDLAPGESAKRLSKSAKRSSRNNGSTARRSSAKRPATGRSRVNKSKSKSNNDDDDDEDFDQESGRNFKCLDNSVALLIKTRFEETMLRIAVVAIIFVAIGIFILFSLPPSLPPSDVVAILIKN